ncbi:MAG: nucleotidyltransferase family protein [Actinobacteria bacterium]|nr:nucleotidyltransferase family protein [Actinomycetota bacterium]MBU1942161.1 nucleotidyltransferase family protein [Actinomycetota bacterium]MBU2686245.1 nucleotidyltransferase family protein [Actinomycetota bacterium]
MTNKELIENNKNEILAAAERHGVRKLRVFGSVARGEARPESDIDFLVELEEGRSLLDQAALLVDLQDLLGVAVDVVSEGGIKPRMRDRILQEAVPL